MYESKISLPEMEKMLYINDTGRMNAEDSCDMGTLRITRLKKAKEKIFKIEQEKCCNYTTKAKFIKKIEFEVCDNYLSKSERQISLSMYECTSCHWRYYADIVRFGFGYNSEYKNKPNFCPGCGRKIDD